MEFKQAASFIGKHKFAAATAGLAAAAGAGGMYHGYTHTPDEVPDEERMQRASSIGVDVAAAAVVGGGALVAAHKFGAGRAVPGMARSAGGRLVKGLRTKGGMQIAGAATVGALIGGYVSDDTASGVAKGAAVGAGAAAVARVGLAAHQVAKAKRETGRLGKLVNKAGGSGMLTLAAVGALAAGAAMTRDPAESAYGQTSESGETVYADSGAGRRSRSMNTGGDLVFGLHRKRRG